MQLHTTKPNRTKHWDILFNPNTRNISHWDSRLQLSLCSSNIWKCQQQHLLLARLAENTSRTQNERMIQTCTVTFAIRTRGTFLPASTAITMCANHAHHSKCSPNNTKTLTSRTAIKTLLNNRWISPMVIRLHPKVLLQRNKHKTGEILISKLF